MKNKGLVLLAVGLMWQPFCHATLASVLGGTGHKIRRGASGVVHSAEHHKRIAIASLASGVLIVFVVIIGAIWKWRSGKAKQKGFDREILDLYWDQASSLLKEHGVVDDDIKILKNVATVDSTGTSIIFDLRGLEDSRSVEGLFRSGWRQLYAEEIKSTAEQMADEIRVLPSYEDDPMAFKRAYNKFAKKYKINKSEYSESTINQYKQEILEDRAQALNSVESAFAEPFVKGRATKGGLALRRDKFIDPAYSVGRKLLLQDVFYKLSPGEVESLAKYVRYSDGNTRLAFDADMPADLKAKVFKAAFGQDQAVPDGEFKISLGRADRMIKDGKAANLEGSLTSFKDLLSLGAGQAELPTARESGGVSEAKVRFESALEEAGVKHIQHIIAAIDEADGYFTNRRGEIYHVDAGGYLEPSSWDDLPDDVDHVPVVDYPPMGEEFGM